MKYGTWARIIRWSIVIVVAVILIIPCASVIVQLRNGETPIEVVPVDFESDELGTTIVIEIITNKSVASSIKADPKIGLTDGENALMFDTYSESGESSITVSVSFPTVFMEVGSTLMYDTVIDVGLDYMGYATVNVSLNTGQQTGTQTVSAHNNVVMIYDCRYMSSEGSGSIGECEYYSDGENVTFRVPEGKISEYFKTVQTGLTIESDELEYSLDADQVYALGVAFEQLEAMA
jgi:hypothetical protein